MKLISTNCPHCGEVMEIKKLGDLDIAICPECAAQYIIDLDRETEEEMELKENIKKSGKLSARYFKLSGLSLVLTFLFRYLKVADKQVYHWTTDGSINSIFHYASKFSFWMIFILAFFGLYFYADLATYEENKKKLDEKREKESSQKNPMKKIEANIQVNEIEEEEEFFDTSFTNQDQVQVLEKK